jgi:hypothetical protein
VVLQSLEALVSRVLLRDLPWWVVFDFVLILMDSSLSLNAESEQELNGSGIGAG